MDLFWVIMWCIVAFVVAMLLKGKDPYQTTDTEPVQNNTYDCGVESTPPIKKTEKLTVDVNTIDSQYSKNQYKHQSSNNPRNRLAQLVDKYNSLSIIHFIQRARLYESICLLTASVSTSLDDFYKKFPLNYISRFDAIGYCMSSGVNLEPSIMKWYECEIMKKGMNGIKDAIREQTSVAHSDANRTVHSTSYTDNCGYTHTSYR